VREDGGNEDEPRPLGAPVAAQEERDGPLVLPDDPKADEQVEDDDGETSGQDFHGTLCQAASDSTVTAMPWPPPMHVTRLPCPASLSRLRHLDQAARCHVIDVPIDRDIRWHKGMRPRVSATGANPEARCRICGHQWLPFGT